jgi:hypothetical protein
MRQPSEVIAMTESAFCHMRLRAIGSLLLGNWALGTSDRGGQDKSRKVRPVGRLEDGSNFNHASNIAGYRAHLAMFANALSSLNFQHPVSSR